MWWKGCLQVIVYNNVQHRTSSSKSEHASSASVKVNLHTKKVLLWCIWWVRKGIVFMSYCLKTRLLSTLYNYWSEQLTRNGQQKSIVFHQGNIRLHVSLTIRQKLSSWLGCLGHPSYSPDLALSDYHLFRSLEKNLGSKNFTSMKNLKIHLDQFFNQKPKKILWERYYAATREMEKVIKQNSAYYID